MVILHVRGLHSGAWAPNRGDLPKLRPLSSGTPQLMRTSARQRKKLSGAPSRRARMVSRLNSPSAVLRMLFKWPRGYNPMSATSSTTPNSSWIGRDTPRVDGTQKVTGGAQYTSDFHFPGMLYAIPVEATIANGRLIELDTAVAEKMPGVQ